MKIADVINQLRAVLPKYTDLFSAVLSISSISAAGGTATITTPSAHGLYSGANIVLKDVETQTGIDQVSQNGLVFTFYTATDHDLTYGWPEHATVKLQGFTDTAWNGFFTLVSVPNRRTFAVQSSNDFPVLNGNEVLPEVRVDGINGRYMAIVTGATTLTVSGDFNDGIYKGGNVSAAHRITGTITEERAVEQYTEQYGNDLWMFVIAKEGVVSKDRSTMSDATATKPTGTDMRMRMIDGFTLLIFKNTANDMMGIEAVDLCRHDLLLPILKSVHGVRFDTGLTYSGDFKSIITGHGVADYNRAVMIYRYEFEVVYDLTGSDTVQPEDTRAFRDIDIVIAVGGDDTDALTVIPTSLDEEDYDPPV